MLAKARELSGYVARVVGKNGFATSEPTPSRLPERESRGASRDPARRFWGWAGLVVLLNFLLIGIVLARGDQREVEPTRVSPHDGATAISTRPLIRLDFPRPIDPDSARALVRLDPPTPGEVTVAGGILTLVPSRALLPNTTYSIVLSPGVREATGRVSRREQRFTFRTRASRLVVRRPDGATQTLWGIEPMSGRTWRISFAVSSPSALAASPDGEELAYVVATEPDRWSLAAVRVDDSHARSILPGENGIVVSLAWSPRGDLLAYEASQVSGAQVSEPRIWLVASDGSQTSLLYGRGEESGSFPAWSLDGRQLAFYENRLGAVAVFNFTRTLLTIPADSRAPAAWSPDGKAIAFANREGDTSSHSAIRVARLDRANLDVRRVTDGQSVDLRPAWSPDGEWIAFQRLRATGQNGIWLVHPDGSDAHPLQQEAGWLYTSPVWAPDSQAVAFSRFPTTAGVSRQDSEIWVVPLQGQPRRLDPRGEVVAWLP